MTQRFSMQIMAGSSGYVLNQIKGGDLVEAITNVEGGQPPFDPNLTAKVLDRLRIGSEQDELATHSPV